MAVGAACGGAEDPPVGTPQPIGGTTGGGTTGGGTTGGGTTGGGTTGGATTGGGTTGGATTGGATTGGATTGGGTTGGGTTGGATTGGGTTGGGMVMNFPGKATGCQSYNKAASPKCGSWYCNLTETDLKPALSTAGKCGNFDAATVCGATLVLDVGFCARDEKSKALGLATNAELRPKVETCVRKRADYAKVTADCMGCFLDAAECAGDKCLLECLTNDNPDCDKCRIKNNCDQKVPACGGLPNTFTGAAGVL
jgi:hypothetical protein